MSKWQTVKLSGLFTLQMGKTPSRNNSAYWNGTQKWVSIADLGKTSKYIVDTKECITNLAVSETGIKATPKDTVIMSFKLSIGKTAITSEEIYTNEAIMSFIDKGTYEFDIDYIYHLFNNKDWSKGTNKAVMGVTLNKATLSQISIPLPPIKEQHKIATNLDKVTHMIDLCNAILEKLDVLVKSRFIELFGDPVSNPHNWEKVPLGELADIKIGPFGTLLHKEDYISNAHALVNPSHIIDGKISVDMKLTVSDDKFDELNSYHLMVNDVVMGRRGEMGRCAVITENGLLCGTGSMIIRTNGRLKADYIQKIISFPSFKKTIEDMAVGQTMPNLNVPIVSNFMIICPPIEVQEQYYTFVEKIDKSKLAVKQVLEKAEMLKKALMQEYFG
jgi:type I restriction enzyme S subunit